MNIKTAQQIINWILRLPTKWTFWYVFAYLFNIIRYSDLPAIDRTDVTMVFVWWFTLLTIQLTVKFYKLCDKWFGCAIKNDKINTKATMKAGLLFYTVLVFLIMPLYKEGLSMVMLSKHLHDQSINQSIQP